MKRNLNNSFEPASATSAPVPPSSGSGQGYPVRFDFWQVVHRALRGQYRRAVVLAVVGAVLGASAGSQLGQRVYTSTGLVRIASVLPQVMHETDQNRPMAMFDGFILAQRDVMLSRELMQAAMEEQPWRRAQQSRHAPTEVQFASSLKVETRTHSDHLKVSFTDSDPAIAAAAVQSIIAAYQRIYVSDHDHTESQRTEELKARRISLGTQLQKLQTDAGPELSGHTSAELELAFNATADCEKKLQADLVDVQCAIAGISNPNDPLGSAEKTPRETVAEERLHCDIQAQAKAQSDLANAIRNGLGESHPTVIHLKAALAASNAALEQQISECEQLRASNKGAANTTALKERQASLRELAESTEQEMNRIAARRAQVIALEQQSAKIQNDLKETDARLDALTTEASLGSRFSVISNGDVPLSPSLDNRAKAAVAGGLFGFAVAVGLLILKNSVNRRYEFGDELAEDLKLRVPFVALLPKAGNDNPLNAAASRGIHELRGQLQHVDSTVARTYLVSSVAPGEGATSIALSLAVSYAATGLRTLLVDCNLNSRTLTRGFSASTTVGLTEALAGDEPSVLEVRAGLFLLLAGRGTSRVAFELVPLEVKRVIASLGELFDVILIDGEPIVTGTTASALAPQVDGVLLVTARGQEQSLIHNAADQVQSLGGTLAGVVFNRAADRDFPSILRQQALVEPLQNLPTSLMRFGPLVGSVMSSLSLTRENDLDLIEDKANQTISKAA